VGERELGCPRGRRVDDEVGEHVLLTHDLSSIFDCDRLTGVHVEIDRQLDLGLLLSLIDV